MQTRLIIEEAPPVITPVKLSITAKIPTKSSGRLLDALTDVIRPFTERMGLKADLIRLQREEVALKVAMLAADRIKHEKKPIIPVPTKTMIRLLESASLEDPSDDTMIKLWANLLASSAINAGNNVPRYISILSDINGQQARLIQDIFTKRGKIKARLDAELLLDDLWTMDQAGVMLRLKQEAKRVTPAIIRKIAKDHLDVPGVATGDIIVYQGREQWDSNKGLFPVDNHQTDFDILESLNLVQNRTFKDVPFGAYELSVHFYCVSHLCVDMFAACNPQIMSRRYGRNAHASNVAYPKPKTTKSTDL